VSAVAVIDNGCGVPGGVGLTIISDALCAAYRHDRLECAPGKWRVTCPALSAFTGVRVACDAVVDDFGNLVRVPS